MVDTDSLMQSTVPCLLAFLLVAVALDLDQPAEHLLRVALAAVSPRTKEDLENVFAVLWDM